MQKQLVLFLGRGRAANYKIRVVAILDIRSYHLVLFKYLFEYWCDILENLEECRVKMFRHGPSVTLG